MIEAVNITPAKPISAVMSFHTPGTLPDARAALVVFTSRRSSGTSSGMLNTENIAPFLLAWDTIAAKSVDMAANPTVPNKTVNNKIIQSWTLIPSR